MTEPLFPRPGAAVLDDWPRSAGHVAPLDALLLIRSGRRRADAQG
jgi:hypothetical protein